MSLCLYLDATATPPSGWEPVRTLAALQAHFAEATPLVVSFNHALGDSTGIDAARWVVQTCHAQGSPMPVWAVHASDPQARRELVRFLQTAASATQHPFPR